MTCGGCRSEDNAPEYYCRGTSRYLYFRCESDSSNLIWNVNPVFQERIILGFLNEKGQIISKEHVTVVVDTIDEDLGKIISYLWLDLGLLVEDVAVTCSHGQTIRKELKQLGTYLILRRVFQMHITYQITQIESKMNNACMTMPKPEG